MIRTRPLPAMAVALLAACGGPTPVAPTASLRVTDALSGDGGDFARALRPRPFAFPADHGAHPTFRSEWWYFTGNLHGEGGRRFGFHLTFFRSALAPSAVAVDGASPWRTDQVWMAHLALADVARGETHAAERFARGALGLAGVEAQPFRVHLGDWHAAAVADSRDGFAPIRMHAHDGALRIDLELVPDKAPVAQGDRGLSRKGTAPGNASYYFSIPRLRAAGRVCDAAGTEHRVQGTAWLDREWSTSALAEGQIGWDWLALQLEDGREVMLYRLRRADGSADPMSAGTVVAADGTARPLHDGDFTLVGGGQWRSPRTGASYPAGFHCTVPALDLALDVRPVLADQELALTFRYWEGAVDVHGSQDGRPVKGVGYLEMTGY